MILPTKHITLSNSLLGVGATLLKYLDRNRTVTSLWNETCTLPEIKTFDMFTLGLDFLFLVGVIDFQDGLLRRVKK
jgi:hypothetical protein